MKGKSLLVVLFLFALLAGSAYGAGPQPVVTFTFVCNNGPFQGSGPCPKGGRPGPLIQGSDGNFYGTAQVSSEGNSQPNGGTVFSLTPTGMFKLLHTFVAAPNNYANGNNPGFLIEGPDGKLYIPVMGTNEIWRISLDGGASWVQGHFLDPINRHAWRRWKYDWVTPTQPGRYTLLACAKAADQSAQPDGHNSNFGSYVIDHPLPIEVLVTGR